MIVSEFIEVLINNKNFSHYTEKHYNIERNKKIIVSAIDLPTYSRTDIIVKCVNCGTKRKINNKTYNKITNNNKEKYYCNKCKYIKTVRTNLEKYGVENVFQSKTIKEKIKKTNLEKYGFENASKNKDVIDKMIETNQQRYGVDHPMQLEETKMKSKKTCLLKYGVNNPMKSNIIKDKHRNTILNKYGVKTPLESNEILEKMLKTNIERYGNTCPIMNKEIKEKSEETLFKNYHVDNPMKNNKIKQKSLDTKTKKLLKKYKHKKILKIINNTYTFMCNKNHEFEISSSLIYNRVKLNTELCTVCNPINSYSNSGYEIQLQDFIKENYVDILYNYRELGRELDIYIPNLKLAFEFNGLYWHSELFKSNNYHLQKTELCEENGIQLIHIYEDDWIYKNDIVKSMILNKLGKTENKIDFNKCEISEITDNKLVKEFLEENHIQGFIGSKVKLGLFYNDDLVSLMTFGKRKMEYELLRFCNKLNTNVIESENKLLKYFIENYKPIMITIYVDRSWSTGDLYKKLGFEYEGKTKPSFYYIVDKKKYKNKSKLEKKIYRIYDSGNLKFIY